MKTTIFPFYIGFHSSQDALNCVEFLDQVLKDVIGSPELKENIFWKESYLKFKKLNL